MSLVLRVKVPEQEAAVPEVELSGNDEVSFGLLENLRFDLEMPADDAGNPFVRLRLPDRKVYLAESGPLTGEDFFRLEDLVAGKADRPKLILNKDGDLQDVSSRLDWSLLDFSGAWVRAIRLLEEGKAKEAVSEASKAVEANPEDAGFRVVEARMLLSMESFDEAKKLFREELAKFPQSYRAQAELAALSYKEGKSDEARDLLSRALEKYPNHLKSLLLLSEMLLVSKEEDRALSFLSRAWRLCGTTAPDLIHGLLERRDLKDLFPKVRESAKDQVLSNGLALDNLEVSEKADEGSKEVFEQSRQFSRPSARDDGVEGAALDVPVAQVSKEDLVRLAAREVYRDGKVSPEEKLIFRKICRAFPIGAAKTKAIVEEEKKAAIKSGAGGGDFVARDLFKRVLVIVFRDGKVSRDEAKIVMGLAKILGLSKQECMSIQEEVKKQGKKA